MSNHTLPDGRAAIDLLASIGEALGYMVAREYAIDEAEGGGQPAAVDLAWMRPDRSSAPLFIIEVESRATNAMANNAVKVLGRPTSELLKPLFFFHVVLASAPGTRRLSHLQSQYQSLNYQIYSVGEREGGRLLADILTQHRRVSGSLDSVALLSAVLGDRTFLVDIDAWLTHYESLDFPDTPVDIVPLYVNFLGVHSAIRSALARRVAAELAGARVSRPLSYLGHYYQDLLYASLMCGASESRSERDRYLAALETAQLRGTYLTKIGPHFGLSMDYDEFVIGCSGPLLAALGVGTACEAGLRFCASQLAVIVRARKGHPSRAWLVNSLWLLHLSAWLGDTDMYEFASLTIDDLGGIEAHRYALPPRGSFQLREELDSILGGRPGVRVPVPSIEELRSQVRAATERVACDPVLLVTRFLVDDGAIVNTVPKVTRGMADICAGDHDRGT